MIERRMSASMEKVIRVLETRGDGTEADPVRDVMVFFRQNGEKIGEIRVTHVDQLERFPGCDIPIEQIVTEGNGLPMFVQGTFLKKEDIAEIIEDFRKENHC